MAYKLVVSKEALKDIDDIVYYIAVELANPTAASLYSPGWAILIIIPSPRLPAAKVNVPLSKTRGVCIQFSVNRISPNCINI